MDSTLSQSLAPSALQVTPNYLQIGDKFARTIFIGSYPRYLNANWLSPIINLDKVMDLAVFINPQPTSTILKQLRDQLARVQAQIMEEEAAGKVRNPMLETAVQDIETLRDQLQQGTEKFFQMGLYLTLYENSPKELDDTEEHIRSILDAQLIIAKQATFRMLEGFLTTSPLADDRLAAVTSLNSCTCVVHKAYYFHV